MDLQINHNKPLVMHIDLNSCFATAAQQANPLLRGKPVVVAAYASPRGCVLSPSIEAKKLGIKTGMRVMDARLIYKNVIVRTPDPPLVRDIHVKFRRIFRDYALKVTPKSIDEAVLDFNGMEGLLKRDLTDIGIEIKQRMREEIGEWISCSIGLGTNCFLAKTAASLKKPDGLEVVDHTNLKTIYARLTLLDLHGISTRFQARLNTCGVFTPLDFLSASAVFLQKQVFQSVIGYYWYLRLRGWEIDAVEFERKSYGQQYALGKQTDDPTELSQILMELCEKMGRRLRASGNAARGVHVACVYRDYTSWHQGRTGESPLYTTLELYRKAQLILNKQPEKKVVSKISVSCFNLTADKASQITLFDSTDSLKVDRLHQISDAIDKVNDRYGEFVITPALMMGMGDLIQDRIAFGGVKELEDLYE